ncbi:MAG: PKD domain-containing protein, partial [Bacteroidota bacterium]
MRRTNPKSIFIFFCLLFLTFSQAQAQEEAFIYGDEFICPFGCGSWQVEFPVSDDFIYSWTIFENSLPNPNDPPIVEITTEGYESITACDLPPGFYTLYLTVSDFNGNTISQGNLSIWVEDFSQQVFGEVFGSITTSCTQDSLAFGFPDNELDCYEVCVGTTSEICLDNIVVYDQAGGVSTIEPSQGSWSVVNGELTPGGSGGVDLGDGNFSLAEVYALPGQDVCVPLTVNNFEEVIGMQFSINYNPDAVQYIGATNFTGLLPGFSSGSIGNPSPGSLTVTWNDPTANSSTLPDGTTLAELCFSITGASNIGSTLNFSSVPVPAEVVYANEPGGFEFDSDNGAINIGLPPNDCANILWNEEGPGRAVFSFWYFSATGCEAYGEINFCFDVTPSPTAGFTTLPEADSTTGLLEICEGQTVFFFSESTDAETHLWDFGDGGGSSLADPQYTYNTAGTYEISLITTTGCDCVDTSRVTVVVEGNETPFVDCVGTICENTSVTYTANTGCSSYGWTVSGNGTVLDGGGNSDDYITVQWGAGPIGEITLETDGCPDLSTCTTAAYLQVPIVSANATIAGTTQVCRGEQSVYSVPPFEGTSFNWSVSSFGTIIAGQGTPSVTIEWFDGFIPSDVQLVSVDYSNCYLECGGSAQLSVNVRPEFYLTGEIEVCENGSADYGVISTQTNIGFPANFNVSTPDGTVVWSSPSAGDLFTIDWNFGSGDFVVTATPQNPGDFCMATVEFLVTVTPQPAAVSAIDGQSNICPGIAYTYSVADPVDGERYRWIVTNGASVTEREGETIALVWDAAGPYSLSVVRLSPPLYCSSTSTDLTINTVSSFAISGDDQVCLDQTAFYTSDQTGDVYYDWSIVPANAGTIAEDPTAGTIEILWHTAGAATVMLDICGQQETFAVLVNAPPQPTVNHPASICPGTTDVVSTTTAFTTYSWQDEEGNELSTSAIPNLGGGYYQIG